jgi:hypothetical protein
MMPTTRQLLQRSDALVFDDPCKEVSSRSRWSDLVWRLDTDDPGYGVDGIAVRWWPGRDDGEAPSPADLAIMEWMKRLAWLGLFYPGLTFVKKVTGLGAVAARCASLVRFMSERSLIDFAALTPEVVDDYLRWISEKLSWQADGPSGEWSVRRSAFHRLLPLVYIWRARRHLEAAGVPVPVTDPLRGAAALKLAKQICDWAVEALPAVPEEAFMRIVNAAADVVLVHSRDVFAAQEIWFAQTGGTGTKSTRAIGGRALAEFRCRTADASKTPWPRHLRESTSGEACSAPLGLRRMISALRSACVIILLATTGLRIREIVAIPGGRSLDAALPDCLSAQVSSDGLLEVFSVTSRLTKQQIVPLETDWLVGSRPTGIGPLPLAARALEMLERLMAPWRTMAHDIEAGSAMLVRLPNTGMPRAGRGVHRATTENVINSLYEFYRVFAGLDSLPDTSCDLAGTDLRLIKETRGRCISVRQYRKNYAQYLLRIDSGLLPAIRTQLHHMRIATTQLAYTGNDPRTLSGPDDEQRLRGSRAIAALLGMEPGTGGRLAELISSYRKGEQAQTDGGLDSAGTAMRVIDETGLRLIPGDHGWCGIAFAPHLSRCNARSGRANFLNLSPDPRYRNPSTCGGCSVFAFDASHRKFWVNRRNTNRDIWEKACGLGVEADYRVAENRMKQAQAFLELIDGGVKP